MIFFKLMNNAVVRIITCSRKKKKLLCVRTKFSYYKVFHRRFISSRNEKKKKTEILINKTVYLGLSIQELSKILMYQFCYDYVKPKYDEEAKSC